MFVALTDLQTRRAGLSASAELLVLPARRKVRYMLQQRGWLAGWLGGWLSVTAVIVSKRLYLS